MRPVGYLYNHPITPKCGEFAFLIVSGEVKSANVVIRAYAMAGNKTLVLEWGKVVF